ncbi:MAG: TIR domain-containing protein [Candidatus Omnitrophota bacterium]
MGKKIFVSYKHKDQDVLSLRDGSFQEALNPTTARDYVDKIETYMEHGDDVYKGERDQEDISHLKDETIKYKLRDKIYDSSVTIVLISPNMRESSVPDSDQWIPWEISYSLKEHARNDRASQTNAVLAVILPDSIGSYSYFVNSYSCCLPGCTLYNTARLFPILRDNMFNTINPVYQACHNRTTIYSGYPSYIYTVKWSDFVLNVNSYLGIAQDINDDINSYNICKVVN